MTENVEEARGGRVSLFCAMARGVGRTTTLVRTAFALQAAGRRVLVVDAGPEENRVRAHLGESDGLPVLAVEGPRGLREALRPVRPGQASPLDHYDHILVDAPVAGPEAAPAELAALADTVVVCFELTPWTLDGAAGFTRDLARGAPGARLMALGHQLQAGGYTASHTVRDRLRNAVDDPAAGTRLAYLEIPHAHQYRGRGPGILDPARGAAQEVLDTVYEEVARYLGSEDPEAVERVGIYHLRRDAAWASWIGGLLTGHGVEAVPASLAEFDGLPLPAGTVALLVSPGGLGEREVEAIAALAAGPGLRLVLVDEQPLPRSLGHHERIELGGLAESAAADLLLRALLPGQRVPQGQEGAPPFPRLPARTNLAPRNHGFVGRDESLEALRESLEQAAARDVACVLQGEPGIGKSELALEYCHRYGGEYEAIWWIGAEHEAAVRAGLRDLAELLPLPLSSGPTAEGAEEGGDDDDTVGAVLRVLGESGGWLLVYDGVMEELPAELLPAESGGRVLVTSRHWPPERAEQVVRLAEFALAESTALLSARLPALSTRQATRVGSILGNVPLAVKLAASLLEVWVVWDRQVRNTQEGEAVRVAVDKLVEEFEARRESLREEEGEVSAPRVMLEVVQRAMAKDKEIQIWGRELGSARTLGWFLDVFALLAEGGATIGFLRSESVQAALMREARRLAPVKAIDGPEPAPDLPTDPLMVDAAVWCLARYGLLEIDLLRRDRPLRQHATLRWVVREKMAPERRLQLEMELRSAVAAYRPDEGLGARQPVPEAHRQLHAVELWESADPGIRRAVVRQVYDLVQAGDRASLEKALEIGTRAEAAWKDDSERRDRADPRPPAEYLRLLSLLSQCLRSLGRYRRARGYALRALRGQQLHYGLTHPRTLLTTDAYGNLLRGLGEFSESRRQCRRVADRLAEVLGPDHQFTIQAEYNLALSELLVGSPRTALELVRGRFDRGRRSDADMQRAVWRFVPAIAEYHRALGQNEESFRLLKDYLGHHAELRGAGSGFDFYLLRVEGGLAVSERRKGRLLSAHERDSRVLAEHRRHLGEWNLSTLTRRISLTADLHLLDKHEQAIQEATECHALLAQALDEDHPFTQLPKLQLAASLRAAGRREESLVWGEEAHEQLADRLEDPHPWLAAAAVCRANTLVGLGRLDEAAELEREAVRIFDDLAEPGHPDRATAARHLADTLERRRSGGRNGQDDRRDLDLELPEI